MSANRSLILPDAGLEKQGVLEGEVLVLPEWRLPKSILFNVAGQNDFVVPLAPGQMPPSLVHIGRTEAQRLCGPTGSLNEFLRLASALDPHNLAIINVCDGHDPVRDKAHLERYGIHTLLESEGAKMIGGMEDTLRTRPNTYRLLAGGLNDLKDTNLIPLLRALLEGRDLEGVKVAVVGVWTNVKVIELARNLINLLGADRVATCSSLTASRNIEDHFTALRELSEIYGVSVYHSHLDLLKWLDPTSQVTLPDRDTSLLHFASPDRARGLFSPRQLSERDALLTECLLRTGDSGPFTLKALGGGFSGSQVFIAESEHRRVVAKVGPRGEAAHERFANERMGRRVRGHVPPVLAYCEGETMAGIIQTLAAPETPQTQGPFTFQELAQKDLTAETDEFLINALNETFRSALGGSFQTAAMETVDLFRDCGFTDHRGKPSFVKLVCRNAARLFGRSGFESAEELFRCVGLEGPLCSPAEFYKSWLPGRTMIRDCLKTVAHGDLNLVNVLVTRAPGDSTPENTWIIDWARLTQLPALTDFAKVENDLSYIVLPIRNVDEFKRALKMQEIRLNSPDLKLRGIEEIAVTPEEKRYVKLIKQLRSLAADVDERGPLAMDCYLPSLLRYAAHTLGFSEPNHAQRVLALCGCGRLAGLIKESNERILTT